MLDKIGVKFRKVKMFILFRSVFGDSRKFGFQNGVLSKKGRFCTFRLGLVWACVQLFGNRPWGGSSQKGVGGATKDKVIRPGTARSENATFLMIFIDLRDLFNITINISRGLNNYLMILMNY